MGNRKLKLLLVVPSGITSGVAYINAALRNGGADVECFSMTLQRDDPLAMLAEKIRESKIDVLLCGGLSFQYQSLKAIFQTAKEANKEIITIGGGGGFTSEPLLFSEMCGVDFAVIGEGEITVRELYEALSQGRRADGIQGLVYKTESAEYKFTGFRDAISDLDALPFPSYEGLPLDEEISGATPLSGFNTFYADEPRIIQIVYSRSCPYKCAFCFHPTGDKYRSRSMDSFFAELDF